MGSLTIGDLEIIIENIPDDASMSPWGDTVITFNNKKRDGDVIKIRVTHKDRDGKGKYGHTEKLSD